MERGSFFRRRNKYGWGKKRIETMTIHLRAKFWKIVPPESDERHSRPRGGGGGRKGEFDRTTIPFTHPFIGWKLMHFDGKDSPPDRATSLEILAGEGACSS